MNGDVQAEQLDERGVIAEAKKCGQVPRVVLVSVDSREFATTVHIAVNATSNIGQLRNPG